MRIGLETWKILKESSPYLLFGFLIAGILYVLLPEEKISKYFGGRSLKSVVRASLLGIPIPLCSCGVMPTGISLYKRGGGTGPVLSFFISTPETGVDSIAITYALLDPIFTVFRPIAAFVTATFAGVLGIFFVREEKTTDESYSYKSSLYCEECGDLICNERIKTALNYAYVELITDTGKWLIIGFIVAGIISALVPTSIVERYLGNPGIVPMLVMLLIGLPFYVCATASTPIASALILKGMSPGAGLVFLLAGPATNIAPMIAIERVMGKKALYIYLFSVAFCSLALGFILNWIYAGLGIEVIASIGAEEEFVPGLIKTISAILLLTLIGYGIYHDYKEEECEHALGLE
ncbi:MAG: SO_0444 family Cu/Zn efflux transporter [Candidatus Hydrothermarchaeota archaeon]